jgi:hypothetical protein
VSADIIYLPDPDRTYVAEAYSILSTNTLTVTTKSGIIQTFNWMGDSGAVVSQMATSAGAVASGVLETERQNKLDQKTKDEAAQKAVNDAELELQQAKTELALVQITYPGDKDKEYAARLLVEKAILKLSAAQSALNQLRGVSMQGVPAATQPGSRSIMQESPTREAAARDAVEAAKRTLQEAREALERTPASDQQGRQNGEQAVDRAKLRLAQAEAWLAQELNSQNSLVFGPVLYAIQEEVRISKDCKGIEPHLKLKAVKQDLVEDPAVGGLHHQRSYAVTRLFTGPPDLRVFPEGVNTVWRNPAQPPHLPLVTNIPARLMKVELYRLETNREILLPSEVPVSITSPTTMDVNLSTLTEGEYKLRLALKVQLEGEPQVVDVRFNVLPPLSPPSQ